MLHNKSMSLKLEKISILLLIILLNTQPVDIDDAVAGDDACALSGASLVDSKQSICPMDLMEASFGLVRAAAARKASKTWAMRRQFWRGENDCFKGEMGTDGSGGQIWQIHRHADAHMDVSNEGAQGGGGRQ